MNQLLLFGKVFWFPNTHLFLSATRKLWSGWTSVKKKKKVIKPFYRKRKEKRHFDVKIQTFFFHIFGVWQEINKQLIQGHRVHFSFHGAFNMITCALNHLLQSPLQLLCVCFYTFILHLSFKKKEIIYGLQLHEHLQMSNLSRWKKNVTSASQWAPELLTKTWNRTGTLL